MAHAAPTGPHTQAGQNGHRPHLQLSKRRRAHFRHVPHQEDIYGIYHPHFIVFLRSVGLPLSALFILFVLLAAVNGLSGDQLTGVLGAVVQASGGVVLLAVVIALAWMVYLYMDWRADHMIISGQRIIVNYETPGIRRQLRDVPMGKVQNIIVHKARLSEPVRKVLGVDRLVIDTAGLGQIEFKDIRDKDAEEARAIILDLQGGVRSVSKTTREQYRDAVVRSILYGTPRPPQPQLIHVESSPRSGYNWFNILFPLKPWRDGLRVIWHRHWWFLLKAEAGPLMLAILFELANLIVTVVGNMLGLTDNPVLNVLVFMRPLLILVLLPYILWQWQDWRNDKFILDKDRLITLYTLPFGLNETRKDTEIRRVVDATVTVHGPTANLLRFGNVVVKTPGEATEFKFEGVSQPFEIHHEIMQRIEAEREREQQQWERDIQDWLAEIEKERRAIPQPVEPQPPPDYFWPI
jgi:membrane protein YdbS with pleckstrin-like domain